MLRSYPHLEDHGSIAGGDTTVLMRGKQRPESGTAGSWRAPGYPPPGEDGLERPAGKTNPDEIENEAAAISETEGLGGGDGDDFDDDAPELPDFLRLTRIAEAQAAMYMAQVNRRGWSQAYRAFHQEHFVGSKYTKPDWRNRSKIFRPKTRSAVRKDMAAVAASLFNNINAINCLPGDEGDAKQRAAAGVMEELVNYRTDRQSGKAALPWFLVALGSRQDSLLTGICLSKQSWKLELRKLNKNERRDEPEAQPGETQDVWVPEIDRPNIDLIPPENYVIDPAADWTNPAQSAAYIIIKWPMHIDEILTKQEAPLNPWNAVPFQTLQTAADAGRFDMSALRRARESGLDRFDETNTGNDFKIVWVYEVFMRYGGEDYTFISVGDKAYLTDPKRVRDVYPEQAGERPLTLGYGSLEAHRIFPMGPVESWQQQQVELNDLINLSLDAIKQNVMPVAKVVRGRNIDLDQVKRRSYGSSILVNEKDDLTWDRPPDIPQSVPIITRNLELEFDDLAGQFNGQTAENNNALSRTLGGLKLVSGTANAVQEYDIRVWIETWVAPALAQLVKLEQYYESDPIVLGICGSRAQLFQKHGVSEVDDALLDQEVTVRVNAGLGAGDPQQRLMKFQSAVQVAMPLLSQSKEFQSGAYQIDVDAVMEEIFGAAGYRDGGQRFLKKGQPPPNPLGDLPAQKIQSEIEKNKAMGKGAVLQGLAAVSKVELGNRQLEADTANDLLDQHLGAIKTGFDHGHKHIDQHLQATNLGHQHGMGVVGHQLDQAGHNLAVAGHHRQVAKDAMDAANQQAQQAQGADDQGGGDGGAPSPGPAAPPAPPPAPAPMPPPAPPQMAQPMPMPPPMATPSVSAAKAAVLSDKVTELIKLLSKPKKITRNSAGKINGMTIGD